MGKTLVDLDRDLSDRTALVLGTKTIKDTVHEAMRRVLADHAHQEAVTAFALMDDEQRDLLLQARENAW